MQIVGAGFFFFFLHSFALSASDVTMRPERRIAARFAHRAHLANCNARALTMSASLCVPVRQTAPRELPSLQEQAVRAERRRQP